MMHAVIDTSIYRQDESLDDAAFSALHKLCRSGLVQLHLSEMVRREFLSYRIKKRVGFLHNLVDQIRKVQARLELPEEKEVLARSITEVDQIREHHEQRVISNFEQWHESIDAVGHPIEPEHTEKVWESYFAGDDPFREKKKREDIPDAYIWQVCVDVLNNQGQVHLIAQDTSLRNTCRDLESAHGYESLEQFVELDIHLRELQDSLGDQFFDDILRILEQRKFQSEIKSCVHEDLEEDLLYLTLEPGSIPDALGDPTITGVETVDNCNLEFDRARYYGDGQIVLPFECAVGALVDYWTSKAEHYAYGPNGPHSTGESNKYNIEVQDHFDLWVEGRISITIQPDGLEAIDNLEQTVRGARIEVDRVERYELY
jgi:hypothetical protein